MTGPTIIIQDEHGKKLQAWQVRAGMTITATDWNVSHGRLVITVRPE